MHRSPRAGTVAGASVFRLACPRSASGVRSSGTLHRSRARGLKKLLLARRSEDLLKTLKLVAGKPYPTRKTRIAVAIMERLAGERLRDAWDGLDQTQRLAVA